MSDADLVRFLTLPSEKVNPDWSSKLDLDGDSLTGPTLDLCGTDSPSELLRTARRQTDYTPSDGSETVSNEVVTYKPGGIQKAIADVTQETADCPSGMVVAKDTEGGMASYKVQKMLVTSTKWLPGTISFVLEVTRADGNHYFVASVYQFRGNVMSVVYGPMNGQEASSETMKAADAVSAALMSAIPDSNPV